MCVVLLYPVGGPYVWLEIPGLFVTFGEYHRANGESKAETVDLRTTRRCRPRWRKRASRDAIGGTDGRHKGRLTDLQKARPSAREGAGIETTSGGALQETFRTSRRMEEGSGQRETSPLTRPLKQPPADGQTIEHGGN